MEHDVAKLFLYIVLTVLAFIGCGAVGFFFMREIAALKTRITDLEVKLETTLQNIKSKL
jgi:hypothetical protein